MEGSTAGDPWDANRHKRAGLTTVKDMAGYFGVPTQTIYSRIKAGTMKPPHARLGVDGVWIDRGPDGDRRRAALDAGDPQMGLLTIDDVGDLLGMGDQPLNHKLANVRRRVRSGVLPPPCGKVGKYWVWEQETLAPALTAAQGRRRDDLDLKLGRLEREMAQLAERQRRLTEPAKRDYGKKLEVEHQ